jgi:hypothetical protein
MGLHGLLLGLLYCYMWMMFVPYWKHAYGPARPVTGITLLLYVDDARTLLETRLWASTACYGDDFTVLYVDNDRTAQETPVDLHGLTGASFLFAVFARHSALPDVSCV